MTQDSERLTRAKRSANALRVAIAGALEAQSFGPKQSQAYIQAAIENLATAELSVADEITSAAKSDEGQANGGEKT